MLAYCPDCGAELQDGDDVYDWTCAGVTYEVCEDCFDEHLDSLSRDEKAALCGSAHRTIGR